MFQKILIANRGEIAVRIIRAARELGIATVAIHSDIDADSLAVQLADEACCVGPAPAARSYLNIPNIISAALITGADAIHPGYGFMAESAFFAEICAAHGIKFIGPSPEAIARLGDKAEAKRTMQRAGLPVIPGTDGVISDCQQALDFAAKAGYPVIVKAAGGGGGKGMRVARNPVELEKAVRFAQAEASAAFGAAAVYVEKFLEHPRHVEVQVVADEKGNAVHLGERDCSLQRKHQKITEEAPSPVIGSELRAKMGRAAIEGALAAGYTSVGTMEFLVDAGSDFYFMEMNTRIQVEHPVTEMITGLDLVKEQILIAAGERLSVRQEDVRIRGHAIECRICAEDPDRGFMPCPGMISELHLPGGPGVRVDTALYRGTTIPPTYDSLIAKVITWGRDRDESISRMERALDELAIEGIATNIGLQREIVASERFRNARIYADDDVVKAVRG